MKQIVTAVALLLSLCTLETAVAASQRTFVASNGNDAFPCSPTQPCRSFGAAIGKTSANGEVVVLDSAGYGPVLITRSVSIIAPAGVYAGVTVTSGSGITIDGAGIVVTLRGLSINGQGQGGSYAIYFLQGASLSIAGCEITKFDSGMVTGAVNSRMSIQNTNIRDNAYAGIYLSADSGGMQVSIVNSEIANNIVGVQAAAMSGSIQATIARSTLTNNHTALAAFANPGGNASILSDGNTITYSNTAFSLLGGGTTAIFSPDNNTVGYYGTLISGGALTPCCHA